MNGYKTLAVATALGRPDASFDGKTLRLGETTIDTSTESARAIESALEAIRHAEQDETKPRRGKTTTPEERRRAESYERALRSAGAETATVA